MRWTHALSRRLSPALAPAALVAACLAAGCSEAPRRDCSVVVWARGRRAVPTVTGSFNDWALPGQAMTPYGEDGWHYALLTPPPGEYGYLITDDKGTHPDAYNPQRTYRGEQEVSLAVVADCNKPEVKVESVDAADDGAVTITGTFLQAASGAALASARAVGPEGKALEAAEIAPGTGRFVLRGSGFSRGKYTFHIEAADASGAVADAPAAVAWVKPAARRWDEGLLYQVIIDRFRGDGGAALAPPMTPGRRAGGTLDGVRAAVESGYFESLGVSALWLSPVYENPTGLFIGRDGNQYEAYHGYWPLASRGVEPQIGGEEALRALVSAAHRRGLGVILDFVPNHLHEKNPRYVEHAEDQWFNDGPDACVCGKDGCPWDLDCWFEPFLPDVRWQSAGSMQATLEDARFWMGTFDIDGVRIDAVPLMPRLATRRMTQVLRDEYAPAGAVLSIGEVYTGPGREGSDAIRYFLGPYSLGGAFDFPLVWAMRDVIASRTAGWTEIEGSLSYTEETFAGSGAVIGRMVDNHDMQRFLSVASGHEGANAWSSPAPVPVDPAPYERLRLALALVMTLPGLPVLYHGDEVGLAGGSDPDNRRVMPDEAALSASQRGVLDTVRRLGKLRACSRALSAGARSAFLVEEQAYAFSRVAPEESALVMFSTAEEPAQIVLPLRAVPPGRYADALTGEVFQAGEAVNDPMSAPSSVPLEPFSFRILLPESSPCLSEQAPPP